MYLSLYIIWIIIFLKNEQNDLNNWNLIKPNFITILLKHNKTDEVDVKLTNLKTKKLI